MNKVTVRNPVEGEGISAVRMESGNEAVEAVLSPADFGEGLAYLQDDYGNVAILVTDSEGIEGLFIVQSIDLDFS
jgi:hypothetical protein